MTSQNFWDLGRFLKTLSYYGAVPVLSSFDWFQQWFGSRPEPTVDSRELIGEAASGTSSRASGSEKLAWVTGDPNLAQPVARQLEAAGYRVLSNSNPELDQLQAIVCCGPTALDRAGLERLQASGFGVVQRPIFDFSQQNLDQQSPANLQEVWGALDDVVMGGVSQSSIRFGDGVATFAGNVSTANSGGFASVRTRNLDPALDLSAYEGIELRVKGDGQRYKFMLRTETRWDGVAYCASFDTDESNKWQTVRIPFAALVPVFRARTVADSPIDPRRVTAWQIMLSKFEYDGALNPYFRSGQFQLQLVSIRVYRPAEQTRLVWLNPSPAAEQFLKTSGLPHRLLTFESGEDPAKLAEAVVTVLTAA